MHAEQEVRVSYDAALTRLANLVRSGWLSGASEGAYDEGLTALIRVGPLGTKPGVSKLVRVQFRELVVRTGSAVLTLRWEAAGTGGALFPALDADIIVTPTDAGTSMLTLNGAYRPPLAALGVGLDRAIMGRVAGSTMRDLLERCASAIAEPAAVLGGAKSDAAWSEPGWRSLELGPQPET